MPPTIAPMATAAAQSYGANSAMVRRSERRSAIAAVANIATVLTAVGTNRPASPTSWSVNEVMPPVIPPE